MAGGGGGTRKAEERIQITVRKTKKQKNDQEVTGLETRVTVQPTHSTVIPKPHAYNKRKKKRMHELLCYYTEVK